MRPCGLYVHVPYCLSKCGYCSFCSAVPVPGETERFGRALLAELERRVRDVEVTTLYVGGGTPTVMPAGYWREFLDRLRSIADLSRIREATLETNPAAGDPGLARLLEAGFDRLSIGVQSFVPGELETLGRRHTAGQAVETFRAARSAGFRSLGLDLIYGIPGQTAESWRESLDAAVALRPEHLSCYELSLEEGTPMHDRVSRGALHLAEDDLVREMYRTADALLTASGYLHYEVSNFALGPGAIALHNGAYWDRSPYVGLGPSAHSFDGGRIRSWTDADPAAYLTALEEGGSPEGGREVLASGDIALEMLMLGLRRSAGVDLAAVAALTGVEPDSAYAARMLEEGKAALEGSTLLPTAEGMLFADGDALLLLGNAAGI